MVGINRLVIECGHMRLMNSWTLGLLYYSTEDMPR